MNFDDTNSTYESRYSGILAEGFGIVPRLVLTDQTLSPSAKLLYSYLACCVDRKGEAFPSIQKIRDDLGLGRDVFRKCRAELEEAGYISVFQRKQARARFGHSVFVLNFDLNKPGQEAPTTADDSGKLSTIDQNPRSAPSPENQATVNQAPKPDCGKLSDPSQNPRSAPSPDLPATVKQPTKNTTWIDNPSNLKDNLDCKKAAPPASDGRTDFEKKKNQPVSPTPESPGFAELCAICVNRNLLRDPKTSQAYDALVAEDYTPEEIITAWKRCQNEAKEESRPARYYPQLFRWLTDDTPHGARGQIDAARARRTPTQQPKPTTPRRPETWAELATVDEAFARIYAKHSKACKDAYLSGANILDANKAAEGLRSEVEAEAKRALARWDKAHSNKEVSAHARYRG